MLLDLTNLALAGLGFMHGDAKGSVNRKPTALQLQVQRNVAKKAYGLYMHIGRVASADRNITFASFVGRDERSKYPLIDADKVDGLAQAGLVDPLPFLDKPTRAIVTSESCMFPHGVASVGTSAVFTA